MKNNSSYVEHNIGYAVRITMTDPPGAPTAEFEGKIIQDLSTPPNNYHVQSTRFYNDLGLQVFIKGSIESIIDHGTHIKRVIDSYSESIIYNVTPMLPLQAENSKTFGENLRELRKNALLGGSNSLTNMAHYLDVDYSYISKLEHNKESPSSIFVRELADLLQYDETVLRCLTQKPPEEMLELISQNPFWMSALLKIR